MTKKLYAFGDSWTDKDRNEGVFVRWPEVLASLQGCDFENLGLSGCSNTTIFNRFLETFYRRDDIGTVCILWSGPTRIKFGPVSLKARWMHRNVKSWGNQSVDFPDEIPQDSQKIMKRKTYIFEHMALNYAHLLELPNDDIIFNCMLDFLIQIKTVQELCKSRNIKLYMAQAFAFTKDLDDKESEHGHLIEKQWKNILRHKDDMIQLLDLSSLYGWPFNKKFGGFSMADLMEQTGAKLLDRNYHPTAEGHEFIADTFCTFMDK